MKDSLGDRIKGDYESRSALSLTRKIPVIIRCDGKAFSSLTRGLTKPYCRMFAECMWAAAKYACENIQGARLAYVQSDEISILVTDYEKQESEAWFDYKLQKMVSVSASMVTAAFGREHGKHFPQSQALPVFDARAFSTPIHEVCNYFIWRQQDCTRNSINCLAQANFHHKQLHGLSCDQLQELLFQEKQINWNDCPVEQKRGVCIRKVKREVEAVDPRTGEKSWTIRSSWEVDYDIPVFTQNRSYVTDLVLPPEHPDATGKQSVDDSDPNDSDLSGAFMGPLPAGSTWRRVT